jgi:hypothetical protein
VKFNSAGLTDKRSSLEIHNRRGYGRDQFKAPQVQLSLVNESFNAA